MVFNSTFQDFFPLLIRVFSVNIFMWPIFYLFMWCNIKTFLFDWIFKLCKCSHLCAVNILWIVMLPASNWSCILTCAEMMIPFLNHLHDQQDCLDLVVKSTALPLLCTAVTATLHWSDETKEKCGQFLSYLRHVYRIIGHSVKKKWVRKVR